MTTVEVCPICDIAGCRHIRERKAKMTHPTDEELDALVAQQTRAANKRDEFEALMNADRTVRAITALRAQLAELWAERDQLQRLANGQDEQLEIQGNMLIRLNSRCIEQSARADLAEAALADADAMIEAQAKDHAENNIRLAEMAHRVSQLAEVQAELSRRVDMHECAMAERDDATLYGVEQKARADRAKAALAAQIEVEPVAWRWESCANSQRWNTRYGCEKPAPSDYITDIVPLYATQPHDRTALDRVRAEARENALREAIEAYPKGIGAILALIEKKVT